MVASGGHGAASTASVGNVQALHEIKRAEDEVRKMKASADKRAEATLQAARAEGRELVEAAKKNAQLQADTTIQKAVKLAESKAEGILQEAEKEAGQLRNVSDATLDEAATKVLSIFKDRVGGA